MTLSTKSNEHEGLLLPGLDGTNPLGFLAALGLFHLVDAASISGQTRLQWTPSSGTWIPALLGTNLSQESLLDMVTDSLPSDIQQHPVHILDLLGVDDPSDRTRLFEKQAHEACATDRIDVDWLSALASDIIPSSARNQLQTSRRDYYYGNLTSIIRKTTSDHLRRAIFSPWDYNDALDNQSLHIEPSEDRRHAHQWNKPAGDPDRKTSGGMLGANRLAIEAFVLFTSLPYGETLHTIGFTGQRSTNTRWTWPIWNVSLPISVVRSLLTLKELQDEVINAQARARMCHRGIVTA